MANDSEGHGRVPGFVIALWIGLVAMLVVYAVRSLSHYAGR